MARCGIMYQISKKGFEEQPTTGEPKIFLADRMASLQTAVAILAALHYRERTGKGQWIDVAKLDTIVRNLVDGGFNNYLRSGAWEPRARKHPTPGYDLYKCKDRYVMLAMLGQRIMSKFLKVVGREDLISLVMKDRQILRKRPDIKEEYEKIIDDFVSTRTRDEVLDILSNAGIPADPANTVPEAVHDRQLRSRGMFLKAYHPELKREVEALAAPVKMSETPGVLENPFPILGEDTEEVLTTLLDYTKEDVTALEKEGVLT
jgi:crotonobetainyl-CoA:carnitine CoA-transferase CaiB-like acyl-CoA transferase